MEDKTEKLRLSGDKNKERTGANITGSIFEIVVDSPFFCWTCMAYILSHLLAVPPLSSASCCCCASPNCCRAFGLVPWALWISDAGPEEPFFKIQNLN